MRMRKMLAVATTAAAVAVWNGKFIAVGADATV